MSKNVENNLELEPALILLLQELNDSAKMNKASFIQLEKFSQQIKNYSITTEELILMKKLMLSLDKSLENYEIILERMFSMGIFSAEHRKEFQLLPIYQNIKQGIQYDLLQLEKHYLKQLKPSKFKRWFLKKTTS